MFSHFKRNWIARVFGAFMGVVTSASVAEAMPAPNAMSVLILDTTIGFASPSLEESKATAQGLTPVVVNAAIWGAMPAADFATYRAIILGDATCTGLGAVAAAEANRAVWSPAITGNMVVVGTDPTFHSPAPFGFGLAGQGDVVTDSGIAFATAELGKTGAYITLSCYYHGVVPATPVPLLDQFGSFTVTGVGCYNDSHIVAVHPALSGLTDASLSDWSCSVHEAFDSFPGTFLPLAIAENIPGAGSLSFADGTFGIPYIIARGEELSPVACGNGVTESPEECDDGNVTNGDGCSAQCKIELCGNGQIDSGETCDPPTLSTCGVPTYCDSSCQLQNRMHVCGDGCLEGLEDCDDGNMTDGDGCSSECAIENEPPDCSSAMADPAFIWPPNHKMVGVFITGVTDPDGDPVAITITSVRQDEPTDTFGDGTTCPDAEVVDGMLSVRAERSGTKKVPGNGRVYHIKFTADDGEGGICHGHVRLCVPHDMGQGSVCVDDGSLYDSMTCS